MTLLAGRTPMTTAVLLLPAAVVAGNNLLESALGAPLRAAASAAALGLELPLVDASRRSAPPNRWPKPTPSGTRSRTDSTGAPTSSASGSTVAVSHSHATLDMDSAKPKLRAGTVAEEVVLRRSGLLTKSRASTSD